jgi:hypothetical protein
MVASTEKPMLAAGKGAFHAAGVTPTPTSAWALACRPSRGHAYCTLVGYSCRLPDWSDADLLAPGQTCATCTINLLDNVHRWLIIMPTAQAPAWVSLEVPHGGGVVQVCHARVHHFEP